MNFPSEQHSLIKLSVMMEMFYDTSFVEGTETLPGREDASG